MRTRCGWAAAACVAACAGRARAEGAEEAVRFQYAAPAECPDADSFSARVRTRTMHGRTAEAGELARTFSIEISPQGEGFMGAVEFLDDAGATVSRHVSGERCEPVVDSLALITALALDAALRETDEPPGGSPETAPFQSPPSAKAPVIINPPLSPPRPPEPWRLAARVGVTGVYDSAIDAPTLGLVGQVDARTRWSLRLVAHLASSEAADGVGRRADLRLLGLQSSVCYAAVHADGFVLWSGLGLDLGSLRAEAQKSERLVSASGKTIFWASVGPELRLAWEPPVPFWLELRGTLGFPLVSHVFQFAVPLQTVYEVPRFTQTWGVATGVRF